MLVAAFFFVTVSARITGEIGSSSSPTSGMTVATLLSTCLLYLLLGWTSPADRFMALTTAAIVGMAASNGGTTAQDLKTAYLVGATPSRQQIAILVGVVTSALCVGPVLAAVNRGATATVPEVHPGVRVTHPSEERVLQREFPFRPAPETLSRAGLSGEELFRQLWGRGLEVRLDAAGSPVALRTFRGDLQPTAIGAEEVRGTERLRLDALAPVAAPSERQLQAGFVRNDAPIPTGKYLSTADGTIEYVVDPGIGGRVDEIHGVKLTRYEAPKARLFSLIVDGVLTRKLPWDLVLLGVALAFMLEMAGVAALPFAVGVYLPISTSAPLFVGGRGPLVGGPAGGPARVGREPGHPARLGVHRRRLAGRRGHQPAPHPGGGLDGRARRPGAARRAPGVGCRGWSRRWATRPGRTPWPRWSSVSWSSVRWRFTWGGWRSGPGRRKAHIRSRLRAR